MPGHDPLHRRRRVRPHPVLDQACGAADWQTVSETGSSKIISVACPSAAFCLAIYGKLLLTSSDPAAGTWRTRSAGFPPLFSLSCPSTTFCAAGDTGGIATSVNPTDRPASWLGTGLQFHGDYLVACPSAKLCVAGDVRHRVYFSTHPAAGTGIWRSFNFDKKEIITSIACPSVTLCVALDTGNNIITAVNPAKGQSAWHLSRIPGARFTALACASTTLCIATSPKGLYFTTNPKRGVSAWKHVASNVRAVSITCPSKSFCVAGGTGQVQETTTPTKPGNSWTTTKIKNGDASIDTITCHGTTLCLAGDSEGNLFAGTSP